MVVMVDSYIVGISIGIVTEIVGARVVIVTDILGCFEMGVDMVPKVIESDVGGIGWRGVNEIVKADRAELKEVSVIGELPWSLVWGVVTSSGITFS